MTLGDIIKAYRTKYKLSMDSFSEKSGISKAYISLLEKNKHPTTGKPIAPSIQCIKQAADGMNMDFNVLFSMINSDVSLENTDSHSSFSESSALPDYPNIFPLERKKYPLLGEIACGEPIFANEDRESYIMSGVAINADFCLKSKGDSMTGARIMDGDIVFIKKDVDIEDGQIYAVIIDDEATLKRVYYDRIHNYMQLCPENPAYKPLVYVGEMLDHIKILGKAVAFQSDVR